MHIEQSHNLTKEEIKKRGDALAESLSGMSIPGGVTVSDISRQWHDDRMDFSFRVSKGFLGTNINGRILVTDANVVFDLDVPSVVSSFVDEDRIEGIIKNKMAEVLSH